MRIRKSDTMSTTTGGSEEQDNNSATMSSLEEQANEVARTLEEQQEEVARTLQEIKKEAQDIKLSWNTRTKQYYYPEAKKQKIHKHHFNPHTITGKIFDRTFETLSEPEGQHICEICGMIYNKSASLQSHMSRIHNPNLTVQCPKCPKMLSAKHALRKHLLSHQPESEWPFKCEYCEKHFQAKGDLPKHFATKKHKDDPEIPNPGTAEFKEVLERCSTSVKIKIERKVKKKKEKKERKEKKKRRKNKKHKFEYFSND